MNKVALIVYGRFPTEKAYGSHLIDVANGFISNKKDVSIIYPTTSNKKTIFEKPESYYSSKNIEFIEVENFDFTKLLIFEILPNFFKKILWTLGAYLWSKKLKLVLENFDTIWSTNPNILLNHIKNTKVIIYEKHGAGKYFQKFTLKKLSNYSNVFFVGTTKTSFNELSTLTKSRSIYLPNGVSLDQYQTFQKNNESKELNIGYIGMLETYGKDKGVKDAFLKIKELSNKFSFKTTLIGGPDYKLNEIVDAFKNNNIEISYSNKIPKNKVPLAMSNLDIGIVPYPNEKHMANYASPMKIFEYAASNVVILASNIKSNIELKDTGLGILYFEAENYDDFQAKLKKLIIDDGLRNNLLEKSKNNIVNFSLKKRFQTLIEFCVRSSIG